MWRLRVMGCIMSRCMMCGVKILDNTEVCPLCRCVAETDNEKQLDGRYPDIRLKEKKLELIGRIVLFLSIVAGTLSVVVNVTHPVDIWWSVIVAGGLAYLQLIVFFLIENQHTGYLAKIVIGTACGIAYVILTDYVCGFARWSLNYVVPSAFLAIDVLVIVLMFVNMRNWQSYLLLQILMILCSGVCVVLSYAHVMTRPVMSYMAFGFSCMMFLAALIIGGSRAINELKRRFHVM